MLRAGMMMAIACCLLAAGSMVPAAAVAVLLAAAFAHTFAGLASSAAGWTFSFDLAPWDRVGGYQGVYGTGNAMGAMTAPAVATWATSEHGIAGWLGLAAMFLTASIATALISTRTRRSPQPQET